MLSVEPSPDEENSITAWRNDMLMKSPTFVFWDLIMRYEMLILIFIRAHREKYFPLYVEVLEELTPLFFDRFGPCELFKMDAGPHKGHEVFARHCQR